MFKPKRLQNSSRITCSNQGKFEDESREGRPRLSDKKNLILEQKADMLDKMAKTRLGVNSKDKISSFGISWVNLKKIWRTAHGIEKICVSDSNDTGKILEIGNLYEQ